MTETEYLEGILMEVCQKVLEHYKDVKETGEPFLLTIAIVPQPEPKPGEVN